MKHDVYTLAHTIANYSLHLKENEKVLIVTTSLKTRDLLEALIDEITHLKALVSIRISDQALATRIIEKSTEKRIKLLKKQEQFDVENFDAFISIVYSINDYEGKNINPEIRKKQGKALKEISEKKINERKWVLLNYPSLLDAYKAKMTYDEFKSYAFSVMNVNYQAMYEKMKPLKELMDKTDKVRIVAKNTDLTFSIKNMPSIPCVGDKNIPDGELYSAPIKTSVNGKITYNTPSPYNGNIYTNVSLTFKDGKIIEATCKEDNKKLNEIFDTDAGARYIGEFSLGFNPKILYPMGDILYDEKIFGSIHFTPGCCYDDCDNTNKSAIHWDMVLIQRKEYGGGEIYFDDVLIRKDGIFVLPELKELNFGYEEEK